MTSRIATVDAGTAQGKAQELLTVVKAKFGKAPNMMKTMAHSPAVLEGYLALAGALSKGVLPATVREQIALAVSQVNECEYCLSAHSLTGKLAGLTPDQITDARRGKASDPKIQAVLNLASNILERRGHVSDEEFGDAKQAGLTDAEINEVVANVALMNLTNYYNSVVATEVDFPRVSLSV